ncbi:MAG: thiamine-phosphate kinase [Bacteroidota bacterium]
MKLSVLGEFGFIKRIAEPFLKKLPQEIVGIGDDCAVIPLNRSASLLVTTDMLIEDIHFIRAKISPRDLGYKSLAVNLSDIAAMGGAPESAFLSIGIPNDIDVEWLDDFYAGIHDLAESEKVQLLGGDTTKSPRNIIINIAVLGRANPRLIKYRSSAKQGDVICVSDFLGDSGGGLKCLLENSPFDKETAYLIKRHNRPRAQIAEGAWLAERKGVHAMMDVSDGIDSDLQRIMERSGCGAEIHIECLPISAQLQDTAKKFSWDAVEIAATGGEDYCLLATIDQNDYLAISEEFKKRFNQPLFNIGLIIEKEPAPRYRKNGKIIELKKHGFDHFNNL